MVYNSFTLYYFTAVSHRNVIAYPGQDVELICDVTNGTAWFINGLGPYPVSQLFNGTLTGYNSSGNNLIIKDIVMNDLRDNYEYQCTTYSVNGDLVFLHVAGEYMCVCHEISVYTLTSYIHTYCSY